MYQRTTLPNGVRIITERVESVRSASIGIWVGVGSRCEKPSEAGCAHYIEHMLFKGTSKYTASQLAEVMDAAGGQINAYTTRDNTCFYARVLDSELPLAINVLSDMFFDSLFAESDVKSECGIILEEIDMYRDTPEDVAVESLTAACFPGALGRPVLGRASVLKKQTGESLRAFKESRYTADRVVIALAGSFTQSDADLIAERFSGLGRGKNARARAAAYTPSFTVKKKAVEQNQLVLGFPGLPTGSEKRFALQLLNGIIGANASSRLFQTVREKYGLCYSVYSFTSGFADTGLFAVSVATNRDTEERALTLIMDELRAVRRDGVTDAELERSRRQIEASILMALESTGSRMNRLGYGELFLGRPLPPDEIIDRYAAVTRGDVLSLARELLDPAALSLSAVGRVRSETEYREMLAE